MGPMVLPSMQPPSVSWVISFPAARSISAMGKDVAKYL